MKKIYLSVLTISLSFTTMTSHAGFQDNSAATQAPGGFQGPSGNAVMRDVKSVLNARDDAQVELIGNIVSSVKAELYIFRDVTGSINVEIDDELWQGITVTPDTKVMIRGEFDKDWSEEIIDVNSLQIIK